MNSILAKHFKEILYLFIASSLLLYVFLLNGNALTLSNMVEHSARQGEYVEEALEDDIDGKKSISGTDLYYIIMDGKTDIKVENLSGTTTTFLAEDRNADDRVERALRIADASKHFVFDGNVYREVTENK